MLLYVVWRSARSTMSNHHRRRERRGFRRMLDVFWRFDTIENIVDHWAHHAGDRLGSMRASPRECPANRFAIKGRFILKSKVTIRFASGREEQFEMTALPGAENNPETRIRQFLESSSFSLQTENEVLIIPKDQIELITIGMDRSTIPDGGKLKGIRQARRIPKGKA